MCNALDRYRQAVKLLGRPICAIGSMGQTLGVLNRVRSLREHVRKMFAHASQAVSQPRSSDVLTIARSLHPFGVKFQDLPAQSCADLVLALPGRLSWLREWADSTTAPDMLAGVPLSDNATLVAQVWPELVEAAEADKRTLEGELYRFSEYVHAIANEEMSMDQLEGSLAQEWERCLRAAGTKRRPTRESANASEGSQSVANGVKPTPEATEQTARPQARRKSKRPHRKKRKVRMDGNAPATKEPATDHAADFRSVRWFGTHYTFTAMQAACVKVLWEHWERGTPEVGEATVLQLADSDQARLATVFRKGKHPAWTTMIVAGSTKGTVRLPERSDTSPLGAEQT